MERHNLSLGRVTVSGAKLEEEREKKEGQGKVTEIPMLKDLVREWKTTVLHKHQNKSLSIIVE